MDDDGNRSASGKEPKKGRVYLPRTEHTLWAEEAPDDRSREEDAAARTGESLLLLYCTDVFDVVERKIQDG